MSGIVGQPGQANYAAANTFLDSFASYRTSLRLPAIAIDLGVVEEYGYVAQKGGMAQHFDERQWKRIDERTLHGIFEDAIMQQASSSRSFSSVTATEGQKINDAQILIGLHETLPEDNSLRIDARFGSFFLHQYTGTSTAGIVNLSSSRHDPIDSTRSTKDPALASALALLTSQKRTPGTNTTSLLNATLLLLDTHLTKTLRLTEPIDPQKSLAGYGLDSLSSIQFRNWINREIGAEVSALEIIGSGSLWEVCGRVIEKLMESSGKAK